MYWPVIYIAFFTSRNYNQIISSFFFFLCLWTANSTEPDFKSKDWVFLNYTYKRFEGLTQRGTIPIYMKAGKAWRAQQGDLRCRGERKKTTKKRRLRTQGRALEPCWCWRLSCQSASQSEFNLHRDSFRSAQPPRELPKALPHYLGCLYRIPVLSFSHSSQATSLSRTLIEHICMFGGTLLFGEIFFSLPKGSKTVRLEDESLLQHLCIDIHFYTGG